MKNIVKEKFLLVNLVVQGVLYHEERNTLLLMRLRLQLLRRMRPFLLLPFDKKMLYGLL